MAQTSRTKSKKVVALSPESYLEFSRQCLEKVRTMTSPRDSKSSKVVNFEQCIYLVNILERAVRKASSFHNDHHHGNSMLFEDGKERTLEYFKILCMLAKKVKSFIQGCCLGHWLQEAVMLTNLSNCTASLVFDLKLFTILLPPYSESDSRLPVTIRDVSAWRSFEGELVKEMASKDEDRLVTKLSALILNGQEIEDDLELATFLLERLDRFKQNLPSITPGSPQPILHERDLTNLKHMEQIGRGGYGTVHKASWLGIDVAVKTVYGADNPDFKKEVSILAGLSHPNIVSFLCHGKDMGECIMVMELMDRDLSSLLRERLRKDRTRSSLFSVFEEFDIMLQIAEAMDYLHKMRVLHRDLKSSNILVRCMKSPNAEGHEYVQVKVSDFGLSRTKDFSMTPHMTPNVGTARWMAPELISDCNTNDILDIGTVKDEELVENFPFKCDVYSFGMVCFEILTGAMPFPDMTVNAVKRAVCAGERPQLPDRCHEKLKALIEKCWNPEASSRPCFGDICTDLRYLKSLHMMRKSQGTWFWTFNISDLRSVTGNFAEGNILYRGDHSVVYKGILAGSKVAVKRMMGAVTRLGSEFIELKVRGWLSVRRRYLVEMLGYCIDGDDLLLVNEYMSQGTLAELLFKWRSVNPAKLCLSWKRRWKIAMDVAQALDYMHQCGSIFRHFDLKSSNVLFDDDFNAKVSGFGLANRFELASLPQGAGPSGYMSPEFTCGGMGEKADHVYSFGVVLMELLTGRPAKNKQYLVTLFRKRHVVNLRSPTLFDPRRDLPSNFHSVKSRTLKSMLAVENLAMRCTQDNPDARPEMHEAVGFLRRPPSGPAVKPPETWLARTFGSNLRRAYKRRPRESLVEGIRENLLTQEADREADEEADEKADRADDREANQLLSLLSLLLLVGKIFSQLGECRVTCMFHSLQRVPFSFATVASWNCLYCFKHAVLLVFRKLMSFLRLRMSNFYKAYRSRIGAYDRFVWKFITYSEFLKKIWRLLCSILQQSLFL